MAARTVDAYERSPKKKGNEGTAAAWRRAWCNCVEAIDGTGQLSDSCHTIVERWIPTINSAFDSRLALIDRYAPTFFYLHDSTGTKGEVLQVLMDAESETVPLYLIFNVPLFQKLHATFCTKRNTDNYLVDADRGTVNLNLSRRESVSTTSAEILKRQSLWYLLFLCTCHAMAHIDLYERTGSCSYDNHDRLRESPFYRLCLQSARVI